MHLETHDCMLTPIIAGEGSYGDFLNDIADVKQRGWNRLFASYVMGHQQTERLLHRENRL